MGGHWPPGCKHGVVVLLQLLAMTMLTEPTTINTHVYQWPTGSSLTVEAGDSVAFVNVDTVPHTVTNAAGPCVGCQFCGRSIDSPLLLPGQNFTLRVFAVDAFSLTSREDLTVSQSLTVVHKASGCAPGTALMRKCQEDRYQQSDTCNSHQGDPAACAAAGCVNHTSDQCRADAGKSEHEQTCNALNPAATCASNSNCVWGQRHECKPDCTSHEVESTCNAVQGCLWFECVVDECSAVDGTLRNASSCSGTAIGSDHTNCDSSLTGIGCHAHRNGGTPECVRDHWRWDDNGHTCPDCLSDLDACHDNVLCSEAIVDYNNYVDLHFGGEHEQCQCESNFHPVDSTALLLFQQFVDCLGNCSENNHDCDVSSTCPVLSAACTATTGPDSCNTLVQCITTNCDGLSDGEKSACKANCQQQASAGGLVQYDALSFCQDFQCQEGQCHEIVAATLSDTAAGESLTASFSFSQEAANISTLESWLSYWAITQASAGDTPTLNQFAIENAKLGFGLDANFRAAPAPSGPYYVFSLKHSDGSVEPLGLTLYVTKEGRLVQCRTDDHCLNQCSASMLPCRRDPDCALQLALLEGHIRTNLTGDPSRCNATCQQAFAPTDTAAKQLYTPATECYFGCQPSCSRSDSCPTLSETCFHTNPSAADSCAVLDTCSSACYSQPHNEQDTCLTNCRNAASPFAQDIHDQFNTCGNFVCKQASCQKQRHFAIPAHLSAATRYKVEFAVPQESVDDATMAAWLSHLGVSASDTRVVSETFGFDGSTFGFFDAGNVFRAAPVPTGPFQLQQLIFESGSRTDLDVVLMVRPSLFVACESTDDDSCEHDCQRDIDTCNSDTLCASHLSVVLALKTPGDCDLACLQALAPQDSAAKALFDVAATCHTECFSKCRYHERCPNLIYTCQQLTDCWAIATCVQTTCTDEHNARSCIEGCMSSQPLQAQDLYSAFLNCGERQCRDGSCDSTQDVTSVPENTPLDIDFSFYQEHQPLAQLELWLSPLGETFAANYHPHISNVEIRNGTFGFVASNVFHPAPVPSGPYHIQAAHSGSSSQVIELSVWLTPEGQLEQCGDGGAGDGPNCDAKCANAMMDCESDSACRPQLHLTGDHIDNVLDGDVLRCDESCQASFRPTSPGVSGLLFDGVLFCFRICLGERHVCPVCASREQACLANPGCTASYNALRRHVDTSLSGDIKLCGNACYESQAPTDAEASSLFHDLAWCEREVCDRCDGTCPTTLSEYDECVGLCYDLKLDCLLDPFCNESFTQVLAFVDAFSGGIEACNMSHCIDPFAPSAPASLALFQAYAGCFFSCVDGPRPILGNFSMQEDTVAKLNVSVSAPGRGTFLLELVPSLAGAVVNGAEATGVVQPLVQLRSLLSQADVTLSLPAHFAGNLTLEVRLVEHPSNAVRATATAYVEVVPVDDAPLLLLPSATNDGDSIVTVVGDTTSLGGVLDLWDEPEDELMVEVSTTVGLLVFSTAVDGVAYSPPLSHAASARALSGRPAKVKLALAFLEMQAFPGEVALFERDGRSRFLTVLANDIGADPAIPTTVAVVPMSFSCSQSPAVKPTTARLADDLRSVVVEFDGPVVVVQPTVASAAAPSGTLLSCSAIFNASSVLGRGAVCSVDTTSTLRVTFGSGATLAPSDTLFVVGGAPLYPCIEGPPIDPSGHALELLGPLSAESPVAELKGPSNIYTCGPAVFAASAVHGTGGRAATFAWSTTPPVAMTVANTSSSNGAGVSTASIDPGDVTFSGGSITIMVNATNFLGTVSEAMAHVLTPVTVFDPELAWINAPATVFKDSTAVLHAAVANCAEGSVAFSYTLTCWPPVVGPLTSASGRFAFNASFPPGSYTVAVNATLDANPAITSVINHTFFVNYSSVTVRLSTGESSTVSTSETLRMTATLVDPNQVAGDVMYAWTCVTGTLGSCRSPTTGAVLDVSTTGPALEFGPGVLPSGVELVFRVTGTTADGRTASAETIVLARTVLVPSARFDVDDSATVSLGAADGCERLVFVRCALTWPGTVPAPASVQHAWFGAETYDPAVASAAVGTPSPSPSPSPSPPPAASDDNKESASALRWDMHSELVFPVDANGSSIALVLSARAVAEGVSAGPTATFVLLVAAPGYALLTTKVAVAVHPRMAGGTVAGSRDSTGLATVKTGGWPDLTAVRFFRVRTVGAAANLLFVHPQADATDGAPVAFAVPPSTSPVTVGAAAFQDARMCGRATVSLVPAESGELGPTTTSADELTPVETTLQGVLYEAVVFLEVRSNLTRTQLEQIMDVLDTAVEGKADRVTLTAASGMFQVLILVAKRTASLSLAGRRALLPRIRHSSMQALSRFVDDSLAGTFAGMHVALLQGSDQHQALWPALVRCPAIALSQAIGSSFPQAVPSLTDILWLSLDGAALITDAQDGAVSVGVVRLDQALYAGLSLPTDGLDLLTAVHTLHVVHPIGAPGSWTNITARTIFDASACAVESCTPRCLVANWTSLTWESEGVVTTTTQATGNAARAVQCYFSLSVAPDQEMPAVVVARFRAPEGSAGTAASTGALDPESSGGLAILVVAGVGLLVVAAAFAVYRRHRRLGNNAVQQAGHKKPTAS
eukprot:m.102529 g.102529  ORF g.102529 m.102529 type:complete len:2593 (-) comp15512_c0_seq4:2099-9877(-)